MGRMNILIFMQLSTVSQNVSCIFSYTGKSLSEALIFESTNPQYDGRLFIEFQVQYMKILSSNLGKTYCVQKLFLTFRIIVVHNMFSSCSSKRRASDKDSPVQVIEFKACWKKINYIFELVSTY